MHARHCWCCHIDPHRDISTMSIEQLCPTHAAVHDETRREHAEAFAKASEGSSASISTYRSRLDGPPPDGHDYTWTRQREQTTRLAGHPMTPPIYSYKWVRDDTLKREKRRDFLSIPVGLFVLLVLYHLVTKLG